jgi:hypothetical protein
MIQHIKSITERSHNSFLGDLVGGAALMVALVGGLYLPGFF